MFLEFFLFIFFVDFEVEVIFRKEIEGLKRFAVSDSETIRKSDS